MTTEKLVPSGGYLISDVVQGRYITRRYFGYTKRAAQRLFQQTRKETLTHAIF